MNKKIGLWKKNSENALFEIEFVDLFRLGLFLKF